MSESTEYTQYEDDPPPCDAPHLTPRADPRRSPGQDLTTEHHAAPDDRCRARGKTCVLDECSPR
ncbi:hypothetical protein FQU76_27010 [Streptomyces qinzhouensis]|uniref:Uncharacterized protein n=1 Tax=Streptomyces qinzhouensis TaxID=2599401 RepID=A0A5B8JDW8_9ACTN|nr:hypothetical protein FQU76_27010 [Streptomyces qinzhouensis]